MHLSRACLLFTLLLCFTALTTGAPRCTIDGIRRINGTVNFRCDQSQKFHKPWRKPIAPCFRESSCIKVEESFSTCFGKKIQHEHTSLHLTDYGTLPELTDALEKYRALRHIPKCWEVLQPFLCSVFFPKCETFNTTDMVYLPSLEMCHGIKHHCRFVYNSTFFPEFLQCNEIVFPSKCSMEDFRDNKPSEPANCPMPLVPTNRIANYFPGIDGCGVQCKDPRYRIVDFMSIERMIFWGGFSAAAFNCCAIATFVINWKYSRKYPALILFYINLCLLLSCCGWMVQFFLGSHDIVCQEDGALRIADEDLICGSVFVLVYYFPLAAMIWFVILVYVLRKIGKPKECINAETRYFHLFAWGIPLLLTFLAILITKINGNSVTGICFLGYRNPVWRAALIFGPPCLATVLAMYFSMHSIRKLNDLKADSIKSSLIESTKKIRAIIRRVQFSIFCLFILFLASSACFWTEFSNLDEFDASLRNFILCVLENADDELKLCKFKSSSDLSLLKVQLVCFFCSSLVVCSWCCSVSIFKTWRNFLRCNIIRNRNQAKQIVKRENINIGSRNFDITDESDPMGMHFFIPLSNLKDKCREESQDRDLPLPVDTENDEDHNMSIDSDINVKFSQYLIQSRRTSADSLATVRDKFKSICEQYNIDCANESDNRSQSRIGTGKSRKKAHGKSIKSRNERRASVTSVESQIIAVQKTTYANSSQTIGIFKQAIQSCTSRRSSNGRGSGNVGLLPTDIEANIAKKFAEANGAHMDDSDSSCRDDRSYNSRQQAALELFRKRIDSSNDSGQWHSRDSSRIRKKSHKRKKSESSEEGAAIFKQLTEMYTKSCITSDSG